jgi:hypothetical protein
MTTKICSKCKGNNIDALVWVSQVTGEITEREDVYYCQECKAKVEIIVSEEDVLSWIEDATIVE